MYVKEVNKLLCESCELSTMKEFFTLNDSSSINANKCEMIYYSGDIILKQGTFVSQIAYLKSGIVKVVLEGNNQKNTILNFIEDRNFVALPVLGKPYQYPFSVVAVTECKLCFIRSETILNVLVDNTEVNKFILNWYTEDYQFLYNKISIISTRNSHGKLAATLLYLTNDKFRNDILNTISRKELAEMAAISVESSNKILLQLKYDRIIDIDKSGIIIKRRDLLEKLSEVG